MDINTISAGFSAPAFEGKRKAVAYVRVANGTEADVDRKFEELDREAERLGLVIVDRHSDLNKTGREPYSEELDVSLEAIREGDAQVLLTNETVAISRYASEVAKVIMELDALNASLVSFDQYAFNMESRLLRPVAVMFAEFVLGIEGK